MTVETLTAAAQAYVETVAGQSGTALQTAIDAVTSVGFTQFSYNPVPLPQLPEVPEPLEAPPLDDVALDLPEEPDDTLLFQDISEIEAGTAPTLDADVPTLTMPTQPSALAEFQATLPSIDTDLDFPEPPSELLNPMVTAPTITERDEPERPQTMLPTFDALAPVDTTEAPTNIEARVAAAYASQAPSTIAMLDGYVDAMLVKFNPRYHEQMGRIETQLATYLDGGTGLDPDVEDAIYERSRDKVDAETRRVGAAAFADAADRGFTLPTGAALAAISTARQAGADNNARAAREIVVLQAEMEQKNLQFAVTTSAGLRTALLNSALSYHQNLVTINGQALEYAKTILAAVVEVYNVSVRAYQVKQEAYKTEALVYETRRKAAMAQIELYQAEIDALKALGDVDRQKVEVYKARIDALQVYANVYRAQIEAVQGRANLEKLKIDVFQAQVQAHTSKVQGKNAEWLGYKASIEGQQAIAGMYGEQVKVFGIETDAWGRQITAKAEIARAQAMTNQARAENFRAVMAGYSTVVQARGDVARTRLENQRQKVITFQAQSQAQIANAQVQNEYYRSTSEIAIKNAALSLDAIFKSAELQRGFANSIAQLHSSNASVHGQLAGAALSGMNTLAAQTLTQ